MHLCMKESSFLNKLCYGYSVICLGYKSILSTQLNKHVACSGIIYKNLCCLEFGKNTFFWCLKICGCFSK